MSTLEFPENEDSLPSPEALLREAEDEPHQRVLEDFRPVIAKLKDEKRFTFREIAEWLTKRGVKTDHSAVWRAYTKQMRPDHADELAKEDLQLEIQESVDEESTLQ